MYAAKKARRLGDTQEPRNDKVRQREVEWTERVENRFARTVNGKLQLTNGPCPQHSYSQPQERGQLTLTLVSALAREAWT